MRIAVVLEHLDDTGANRVSLDRAVRWHETGDEVTVFVITYATGPGLVAIPAGLRIEHATDRHRQLRATLPIALWKLTRLARASDVVVAGTEIGLGLLLGWCAARLSRRPFAVTVQSRADLAIDGYVASRLRAPTRAVLTRADVAVCVSGGLVASLVQLGCAPDRVTVVPNAVDLDRIQAAAAQEPAIPIAADLPLIVSSGRLTRQKGFDLLIRAHARVLSGDGPAHRLMILGDGEDRDALEALVAELGVAASVTLPGFVANPHAIVARAALFVCSSRWEGQPLNLAEALACATPCISVDCVAGPSYVLAEGRYGELVPVDDFDALGRAIRTHLNDPNPLSEKARLAAASDLDMFHPDHAAKLHRDALATLQPRGCHSSVRRPLQPGVT